MGKSHDGDLFGDMESQQCHDVADQLPPKLRRAMALLVEAADYAELSRGTLWDFAISIKQFRNLDLTDNDLRLLIRLDYLEHAAEITGPRSDARRFRVTGKMYFTRRSCFVLTPRGVTASVELRDKAAWSRAAASTPVETAGDPSVLLHVPVWDANRRVLLLDRLLIKHFRHHASNQETILSSFQEEGWPERIDDPLSPSPTILSKRRLHDAIKSLNRKQVNPLIHFHGDGTGEGIAWEELESNRKNTG